LIAGWRKR